MPEHRIRSLTIQPVELPLKNPFVIAVRTATSSPTLQWTLELEDGRRFFGESVPVRYVTGETPESVAATAPNLAKRVEGRTVEEFDALVDSLYQTFPLEPAARTGVEIALANAYSTVEGRTLDELLGGATKQVETDLTIAKLPNAVEIAQQAWSEGFRAFKMKVGGADTEEDLQRVLEVQRALPEARIRLDGNQGFKVSEAIRFIEQLVAKGVNLELVEQPVAKEDLKGLGEVATNSPAPVVADEACATADDARRIFEETPTHGVNVKLMKSGIRGAMEIVQVAREANRKLMIGCMLESPVGIHAALAVACGTGAFEYLDLDGHLLLDLPQPPTEFSSDGPYLRLS